eukprot:scaffold3716_cov69-Cylindrotheca_fusiformis.AAC.11
MSSSFSKYSTHHTQRTLENYLDCKSELRFINKEAADLVTPFVSSLLLFLPVYYPVTTTRGSRIDQAPTDSSTFFERILDTNKPEDIKKLDSKILTHSEICGARKLLTCKETLRKKS